MVVQIIQIVVLLFALFALSRVFLRFKDKKFNRSEFLFWSGVFSLAIILVFIPSIMTYFADLFNIGRGIDLVIYASILLIFYLMFRLYVRVEKLGQDITLLVRKVTLQKEDGKRKTRKVRR